MAVNITPLVKIVRDTITYKVYNGNNNLTPIDFDNGAVVFTCTGTQPLSTPQVINKELPGQEGGFVKVWSTPTRYNYQVDIMKTIPKGTAPSPLVPFEFECFAIINNIQSRAGELLSKHGLGVGYIETRFMVESTHSKPTNRMIGTFTILSENQVKIKSVVEKVNCVNAEPKGI